MASGLEQGSRPLAGYGIAENEQMPDIAADAKAIAFGNFNGVTPSLTVSAPAFCVTRTPINRLSVFYTTKRTGGMLVDSQAIKLLKMQRRVSLRGAEPRPLFWRVKNHDPETRSEMVTGRYAC